jgi:hypothetical protein
VQPGTLYDTEWLQAGVATKPCINFYENVGSTSNKSYAETNMVISRRLPAPEAFSIDQFHLQVTYVSDSFKRLCDSYVAELWIGCKQFYRGPLPLLTNILQDPMKTDYAVRFKDTADPLVIPNQLTFYVSLIGHPIIPTEPIRLVSCLQGLHARGVM